MFTSNKKNIISYVNIHYTFYEYIDTGERKFEREKYFFNRVNYFAFILFLNNISSAFQLAASSEIVF